MLGVKRLGSLVILVAVLALVLSAGSATAAAFAAEASVAPQVQFLGDTSGTVFTFTIHNTGTSSSIGAVEISRPSKAWSVVDCLMAPAGWSIQSSNTMCRYRSQNGTADNIQPASSNSSFKLKAATAGGQWNRTGTFQVIVSKSNHFDNPSLLTAASAEPPGLAVTVYSFEILDALVQPAPASPGAPCPPSTASNHSAITGSTGHTVVVCGKNRTNSTLTPIASQSTLGGSFIAGHGAFSSAPIGPRSPASVVLGNWASVSITGSAGTGKTIVAKAGSAPNQTSPLTTLDDDCLGISGWCVVNGGYEALNQPPDAFDDNADANEDGPPVTIDVMSNDSDPDGDPIELTAPGGTPIGVVSIVGSGSSAQISYDPNGQFESLADGQTATDAFTYTISDPFGATDTASVTVTIHGQNDPPVANDDSGSTDEDTVLIVPADGVLGNDTDVDFGDTKTVSEVNGSAPNVGATFALASGALLAVNADGSYAYDPNGQFEDLQVGISAGEAFTYTMMDSQGATSSATVSITVTGVNDSPVATNDFATTDEDTVLIVPADGVLGNDTDLDAGETKTVSAVNGSALNVGTTIAIVSGALVSVNADGSYAYDPAGQFEDLQLGDSFFDVFTYTMTDSQGATSSANVTITVSGVNDPPVANDDSGSTDEDTVLTVPSDGVLGNDTDVDFGDTKAVSEVNGGAANVGTMISLASGALLAVDADGSYVYDPNGQFEYLQAGDTAADSFAYTMSDSQGAISSATVNITITGVNDPPVANPDFYAGDEDNVLIVPADGVLGNDTDADGGDTRSLSAVNGSAGDVGVQITLPSGALLTLNADGSLAYDPSGQFEYLQAGDFFFDVFFYTMTDSQGATSSAAVTVTVNGQNDPPVANDDSGSTDESTVLNVAADGVLTNDTDVDSGDTKTVSAVNGSAGDVGIQVTLASGALLTLNADGSYAYDPNGQFNALNGEETATDEFDYTMQDSQGATSTATVTITINGITNSAPVAVSQSVSVDEDPAISLSITLTGTDIDDDDLTFSIVTGQGPSGGTLGAIGSPDCTTTINTCTAIVAYDPDADFTGLDSFKFTVNDGQDDSNEATVDITVNSVNDAPSFTTGGNVTVAEDSGAYSAAWATAISAGPADESGQALTFSIQSNDNPSLFSAGPTIASDGTLSFTPVADASGTATLNVVLMDDGGTANGGQDTSAPVSFDIIVTAVNDAPINTVPGVQSVNEDTDLVFSAANSNALSVADIDAGSGDVQVTVSAVNGTITPDTGSGATVLGSGTASATITGTVTEVNDALDGLKYKGNLNFNDTRGPETLTLLTNDQGNTGSGGPLTDSDTVGITVSAMNDAPSATAKSYNAQANMKITGLTGLLSGATDPDTGDGGYSATFTVGTTSATTPAGGTISNLNSAAGSFDFDPPPGASGDVTFTYTVCDSGNPGPSACSAPATVTVSVAGPVIWFVNPAAGVNGDGRLSSPFNNLASAAAVDASGHRIFIYSGTATTGITLNTNEWLIGQGVTGSFDAVFSISPPAGTNARPSVSGTRPVVQGNVAVATSDAVRGLNIQPAPGTAGLTGSGATSLTVGEVSATTSNAAAVNLSSSGGTLSFTSISANGGSSGIVLNNTTGSFTVTGTGGTCTDANTSGCSGGIIQNMMGGDDSSATPVGTGIVLNNAAGVSLTRMHIHDHSNYAIRGTGVNGFTLDNSVVSGVNGTNVATPFNDGSLSFDNLSGTSAVTNSAVSGGYQRNIRVDNTTGALTLTLHNNSIHNTSNAAGDDGVLVEVGGGTATVNVTSNSFSAHGGDHFNLSLLGSPTVDLTFTGNFWSGGHPIGLGQGLFILAASFNSPGAFTYDILNNGTVGSPLVGNRQGGAMHVNKGSGTGTFSGTISNNVIGDPAVNGSGSSEASGIDVEAHGSGGSHTTVISNNLVRQFHNDGILVLAGEGNAALNATVTGNTVSNPDASLASFHGMHFNIGTLPADALLACLDVKNNSLTNAANEANGGVDLRMRQRQLTTVRLPGYAGANNDNAAVQTFLSVGNSNAVTTILAGNTVATGGGGFTGGAACALP